MALRSRTRTHSITRTGTGAGTGGGARLGTGPRTRSRPAATAATSGPGRAPASDGRFRHRTAPTAEEVRRRAEILFAERVRERRESGSGPPGETGPDLRAEAALDRAPEPGPARARLAVRERMPVWLQARCGLRPRSVAALAVLLAVAAVLAVQHFWTGRTQSVRAPEVVRAAGPFPAEAEAEAAGVSAAGASAAPSAAGAPMGEIVVDVSGKVREPGVHRLPAGSRVADALDAAGGVRPGTDTDGLNRARFLVDGEQVVVGGPAPAAAPVPAAGAGGGGALAGVAPAAPVSLNTATAEQLDTLPGVGPVLAQHILDYRTQHGGFRSVDELREVKGIGERRFADLRDLVRP
ncbi:helix-hairpin-helix domain-containing protein [Streptomyces broussonetiae]|uniref:ComEA family DNA-binding protein n=1 Tax=Streptomyces broussonetiae TaxID=2686304 RepID=A0ABV5E3N2_9ACTN